MRRCSIPFLGLAWLATVASPALAQPISPPGAAPPTPTAPIAPASTGAPAPAAPSDPAQPDYDQGFSALLAGDLVTARAGLANAADSAQTPELRGAARELVRLVDELTARQARIVLATPGASQPPRASHEDPDEGRVGVIVTTTLSSLYAGVVLADLTDVDDARAWTLMLAGTTGLGFAASLYGTAGKTITAGTADAYSLGVTLGAANAMLLAEPLGASTSEQWLTGILGGMAVTGAAGFLYGHTYRPTAGQVSFAGTLASLGIASAGLGLLTTTPDISADATLYAMTAGLDLGGAAGIVLGRDLTWSPGHARLIWVGSLLGGLTGLATGVLIGGTDFDDGTRLIPAATLAGVWGGFALTIHLTRNMKPDRRFLAALDDTQIVPIAVHRGAGLGLAGSF